MKTPAHTIDFIATLGAALTLGSAVALADEQIDRMEHKFEQAIQHYAECPGVTGEDFERIRVDLRAFTDMEVMAKTFANPLRTARLMRVVNDPRTMHVMIKRSTGPVMWDTWMRGLTDYSKMMRAALRFVDPGLYKNWMMATMDPAIYQPLFTFMNPAYYTSLFKPNWYTPRVQWMVEPQVVRTSARCDDDSHARTAVRRYPREVDSTGPRELS